DARHRLRDAGRGGWRGRRDGGRPLPPRARLPRGPPLRRTRAVHRPRSIAGTARGGIRDDGRPDVVQRRPRLPDAPARRLRHGGWFFLACGSAQFFHRMLVALGHAELAADPRLENAPWGLGTPEAIDLLVPILEQTFRTQPRDHWIEFFREADVPAQPVLTRDE